MDRPTVVVLCGGRGTRLREHSEAIPKPLVEIGGRPILWHVIRIFAGHGFEHFVLCLGHRGELIEDFVRRDGLPEGLCIECVDTGAQTPTGGRVAKVAGRLPGESFCVTYADGVADIDLDRLIADHAGNAAQGALATMTVVQPELQFGVAELNGDGVVRGFTEKPRFDGWINGGFLCFQREALGYMGETDVLERRPLERLAAEGRLRAFCHEGFWGCLDTYKDALMLNDLWSGGSAPWKLWG